MKTKYLFQCLLVVLCLGFTACQDDDSPKEGPQGEQGIPGEDGENGNANVFASPWIVEQFSNVDVSNTTFSVTESRITQNILDTGVILAYGKTQYDEYMMLPFNYYFKGYKTISELGKIMFIGSALGNTLERFDNFTHVRYVIITSSTSGKNAGVDFASMSYEEVMDYLGLEQ